MIGLSRADLAGRLAPDGSDGPPWMHCLLWGEALAGRLRLRGLAAALVAGTCGWPRLRPDQDDGRPGTATHFSHEFDVTEALPWVRRGMVPEWHCWVAVLVPRSGGVVELADPTTGAWPEKCLAATGLDWPGDRPPPYLWCRSDELPPRVCYAPDGWATLWARAFARSFWDDEPLVLRLPRRPGDPLPADLARG